MNFSQIFRAWFSSILINFMVDNWKMVNNIVVSAIKSANPTKGKVTKVTLFQGLGVEISITWNGTYWEIIIFGLISRVGTKLAGAYIITERLTNGVWAYNSKVANRIKKKWEFNSCYSEEVKSAVLNVVLSRFWLSSLKDFTILDRITGKEKVLFLNPVTLSHEQDELLKDIVVDEHFTIQGTLKSTITGKYTGLLFLSLNKTGFWGPLSDVFLGTLRGCTLAPSETAAGSLAIDIKNTLEKMLTK